METLVMVYIERHIERVVKFSLGNWREEDAILKRERERGRE